MLVIATVGVGVLVAIAVGVWVTVGIAVVTTAIVAVGEGAPTEIGGLQSANGTGIMPPKIIKSNIPSMVTGTRIHRKRDASPAITPAAVASAVTIWPNTVNLLSPSEMLRGMWSRRPML